MLCSEIQLVKPGPGFEDIKPLPCKRWSCEICAPHRRRQLIALAASGEPNKVLTLTIKTRIGNGPTDRRRMLHQAWRSLVKRIVRHHKWKRLDYLAFVEKTKAGEPHLHILLRCGSIKHSWLSKQMRELVGSPVVWIEAIKGTRDAVRYVTKYVTKAPAQFGTLKRYWLSRWYEVNKPDFAETPLFDMAGIHVRRQRFGSIDRWFNNGLPWESLPDGWYRLHLDPRSMRERWGSYGQPADSS